MLRYLTSRIWLTRIVGVLTSFILFATATGAFENFILLRTTSALGLALFGILTFTNGYRNFGFLCVAVALIFYPAIGVTLPRQIWMMLSIISSVGVIALLIKTTDSYQKGAAFEKYIATVFPAQSYNIKTRTHDSSKFLGRYVETDVDPDFVFQDKKTGKSFAVECKWRKGWMKNDKLGQVLSWDAWKGGKYISYGQRNRMPVFVAFGIGGTPDKPAETYFLKAEQLQYRLLKQDLIKSGRTIHQLGDLLS